MKLLHIAALAVLAAAGATTALAAPTTYNFDPNHSFVRFGYGHMGFSHQQSQFDKIDGSITFDSAAMTGAVDVTIPIDSVDTGSSTFTAHLKSPDFFNAAQFPTATFKSTAVRFQGDTPVAIDGNLTIKGVTRPVTLTITHFKQGVGMTRRPQIGGDATGTVKRSDFGLGKYAPMVDDDVTISIDFEAGAASSG